MKTMRTQKGFTLLEVMIALGIFAMIIFAIYATWMAVLRGTRAAASAAAAVQRSRIAIRAVEDAFLTVQLFTENFRHYAFEADTSGDMAKISMVSHLPAGFLGGGVFESDPVRRITFETQAGVTGGVDLVMTQVPILTDTSSPGSNPYSVVLATDVSLFTLEFWDVQKNEWATEWLYTNQLPRLVRVALGTGTTGAGSSSAPRDFVTRIIGIPSTAIAGAQTGRPPGSGGQPNPNQNPNLDPNNPNIRQPGGRDPGTRNENRFPNQQFPGGQGGRRPGGGR